MRTPSITALAFWGHASVKWGWIGHKHRSTQTVDLVTKAATRWLTGCRFLQFGDAGQRDGSRPSQDGAGGTRFHHAQNSVQFKTYELFISGIFSVIFQTAVDGGELKEKTVAKGGPRSSFLWPQPASPKDYSSCQVPSPQAALSLSLSVSRFC